MIPFNGYPRPYGSFSEPVAIPTTEPGEGSQVCVQFGRNWLPYVLGALQQLLLQSTWIYTTETELLEVQGSVFDLIATFGNAIDTGVCLSEPTFRQPDDCSLQVSTDGGITWATIFDARACAIGAADNQIAEGITAGILGGPTQLPPTTPPASTMCWAYHVTLTGNGVFKIPFAINDGWTVEVSNAKGGWYDGNVLAPWFCPDGNEYQLGDCLVSSGTTDPADPLPTQNHMALLLQYGSVFVDAYNTTYTIPAGTGTTDCQLRANDSVLSDNAGAIEFDLSICNGTPMNCPDGSDWDSFMDFRTELYGWTVVEGGQDSSGVYGQFVDVGSKTLLEIALSTDSCEVVRVAWTATRPAGSGPNDIDEMVITGTNTGPFATHSNATGNPVTVTRDGDGTNCTHFDLSCNLGSTSDSSLRLLTLHICGKGAKPPQLP